MTTRIQWILWYIYHSMYIVWLRDSICLVMRVRVCVCDAQLAETLCRQSYIYSSQSISKYVVSIHSTLSRSSRRFYHQQYTHHNSCEYRLFWSMKTIYKTNNSNRCWLFSLLFLCFKSLELSFYFTIFL